MHPGVVIRELVGEILAQDVRVIVGLDEEAGLLRQPEDLRDVLHGNAAVEDELSFAAVIDLGAVVADNQHAGVVQPQLLRDFADVHQRAAGGEDEEIACGAPVVQRLPGRRRDFLLAVSQCSVKICDK